MSGGIRLDSVTVNAPDALALAEFYAEITDGVAHGTSQWAAAVGPHGFLAFQQVAEFRPPQWPGTAEPMHMPVDFLVDDLEASGTRVLAAGARLLAPQPNSDHCLVYADPAGHPFCLSTWEGRAIVDNWVV